MKMFVRMALLMQLKITEGSRDWVVEGFDLGAANGSSFMSNKWRGRAAMEIRDQQRDRSGSSWELGQYDETLAALDAMSQELQEADSLSHIKHLRESAEAVRVYARRSNFGILCQNAAATLRLEAERKAGRILKAMKLRGGRRNNHRSRETVDLGTLGISQNDSTRWQRHASVPENVFREYLDNASAEGKKVSGASLCRFVISRKKNAKSTGQIRCSADAHRQRNSSDQIAVVVRSSPNVEELRAHLKTMVLLIPPVETPGETLELSGTEWRHIRRLLQESLGLVDELSET